MALGDVALAQGVLDRRVEVEEAEGVGDRGPGAADSGRDLVLGQPELVGQLAVGVGLFHGVEVRALDVLDDGDGKLVALGELADDGRDVVQPGHLRGANAPLAGDELVSVQDLRDEHGLEHAVDGDARRKALQRLLLDALAGLIWVAFDPGDRDLDGRGAGRARLGDERSQSSAQTGVALRRRRRHCPPPEDAGGSVAAHRIGSRSPGAASSGRRRGRACGPTVASSEFGGQRLVCLGAL